MDDPGLVIDGLFIGSKIGAQDKERMKKLGITHIVNTAKEIPCFFPDDFMYLHLDLEDDQTENDAWEAALVKTIQFITEAKGKRIFVHCQAGISRSTSLLMGYLMQEKGYSLKRSFLLLKEKRSCTGPNLGYWNCLMRLEESLYEGPCTFSRIEYESCSLSDMGFDYTKAKELLEQGFSINNAISVLLHYKPPTGNVK